jgi:hypothetical protein
MGGSLGNPVPERPSYEIGLPDGEVIGTNSLEPPAFFA